MTFLVNCEVIREVSWKRFEHRGTRDKQTVYFLISYHQHSNCGPSKGEWCHV